MKVKNKSLLPVVVLVESLVRVKDDESEGPADLIFRWVIPRFRRHEITNALSCDNVGRLLWVWFDFLSKPT